MLVEVRTETAASTSGIVTVKAGPLAPLVTTQVPATGDTQAVRP